MRRMKAYPAVSYALSFSLIIAALVFAYTTLVPITVLQDWRLILKKNSYTLDEIITVESAYTKTRNVTGIATRYIECKNDRDVYVRYELSVADANRAPSAGSTGIVSKIPNSIVPPTSCRFSVNVCYQLYRWRNSCEYNSTSDFEVLPAVGSN